jgi:hypothetical protein
VLQTRAHGPSLMLQLASRHTCFHACIHTSTPLLHTGPQHVYMHQTNIYSDRYTRTTHKRHDYHHAHRSPHSTRTARTCNQCTRLNTGHTYRLSQPGFPNWKVQLGMIISGSGERKIQASCAHAVDVRCDWDSLLDENEVNLRLNVSEQHVSTAQAHTMAVKTMYMHMWRSARAWALWKLGARQRSECLSSGGREHSVACMCDAWLKASLRVTPPFREHQTRRCHSDHEKLKGLHASTRRKVVRQFTCVRVVPG